MPSQEEASSQASASHRAYDTRRNTVWASSYPPNIGEKSAWQVQDIHERLLEFSSHFPLYGSDLQRLKTLTKDSTQVLT